MLYTAFVTLFYVDGNNMASTNLACRYKVVVLQEAPQGVL